VPDEAEREASDESHVLGAVPGPVSGEVVLEDDIEKPVHAFDAPMATDGFDDAFDVEGSGRDIGPCIEGRTIGMLGSGIDLDDGLDGGEARLFGIAAFGRDPVDDVGGGVGAGFDAAMRLLYGGLGDELGGRRGLEIVDDSASRVGWLPLRAKA
jgi:hypothetical protein